MTMTILPRSIVEKEEESCEFLAMRLASESVGDSNARFAKKKSEIGLFGMALFSNHAK